MTRKGLERIIKDVEKIARRAIKRGYPWMQASDVDDVIQNALIRIVRKIETFNRSRPARPWISTVAIRTAADWFEEKKSGRFSLMASDEIALWESDSRCKLRLQDRETSPRPDSKLLEQEEKRARCLEMREIWSALGEADENSTGYKEVLLLQALGYRGKRLAEALKIKTNAAEVRTYRLKGLLRKIKEQRDKIKEQTDPDMD